MFLKRENGKLGWHYVLSLFDLSDREERDMRLLHRECKKASKTLLKLRSLNKNTAGNCVVLRPTNISR